MNLFSVGDTYVQKIVNSQARGSGKAVGGAHANIANKNRIKVLLLDKDTTSTISMCATQSDLLNNEIYLVETLENDQRDIMRHLKCLVYVKPTERTIDGLIKELRNPKYGEYHIFFSNIVSKSQLEQLAEADDLEVVVKVEEIFQDYQILNEYLFSLDMKTSELYSNQLIWDEGALNECTGSVISLLLSLRIKPTIRYDSTSKVCLQLAKHVDSQIQKHDKALFDFPLTDSTEPTLIILDRNNDPLTPLLQPWTYQSMIHEYIGIKRNIVDLSKVPGIDKDMKKVTLSSKQDAFFHDTMYLNYGDLGDKVKDYVSNYKDKTQSTSELNTIEDIKGFIEKYPEIKKLSGNVTKHMTMVSELDRQLKEKEIWELSEVEQNLVVHKNNQGDYEELIKLLKDPELDKYYKLKIAAIYMIRHDEINENKNIEKITEVIEILKDYIPIEDINYLHKFRAFFSERIHSTAIDSGNQRHEKDDLFTELAKKFNTRMDLHRNYANTSENVYMQHIPKVSRLLTDLSKGNLSEAQYKFLKGSKHINARKNEFTPPPQDIIIFIVGGVTFEESRFIYQFNQAMKNDRMRVILGGTSILSTKDFLYSLK